MACDGEKTSTESTSRKEGVRRVAEQCLVGAAVRDVPEYLRAIEAYLEPDCEE